MSIASIRRYDRTPQTSPTRKKQKMEHSSPGYGDLDLSEEDFQALDEIEHRLSQSMHSSSQSQHDSPSKPSKPTSSDENPFQASQPPKFAFSGFSAASAIPVSRDDSEYMDRSSPGPVEEKDYSSWFDSGPVPPTVGFQTAKSTSASTAFTSASMFSSATALLNQEQPPSLGFRTAKGNGLLAPSAEALAKAREKMKDIWQDDASEASLSGEAAFRSAPSLPDDDDLFKRLPFRSVQNSIPQPETPCPPGPSSGFGSASQLSSGFSRPSGSVISLSSNKPPAFVSPLIDRAKPSNPKAFKSPILSTPKAPLTPVRSSNPNAPASVGFASARSQHPLAAPPTNARFQTPIRTTNSNATAFIPPTSTASSSTPAHLPTTSFSKPTSSSTPARRAIVRNATPTGSVGPIRTTPAKFVTPFKKGMKPGEAGRAKLEEKERQQSQLRRQAERTARTPGVQVNTKVMEESGLRIPSVFDMTPPANRMSLLDSGLMPQQYTTDDMAEFNVAIAELSQITTPSLALYYSFYRTPQPSDSPSVQAEDQIGPAVALEKLLAHGCSRATKAWVDNAWCLILWKLAGMVALEPERETGAPTFGGIQEGPRWCWDEVWRQLLYRYEREMNLGTRPPLRLITTQDHSASAPMVLCISNIIWPEPSASSSDGQSAQSLPQLEVTDGWYLLKAQIDPSMAHAIRRGLLRVGKKIAVVGARLSTERKDPLEPLEAYNSTKLIISSNSCKLAPWHAKLGFQRGPYVFTMHSLTPDGGNVATMDVVVLRVHPIAYLETRSDENGNKIQEGPRTEADEAACKAAWMKKREAAEAKLNEVHEKKVARYQSYAERLEQKAARSARVPGQSQPDHIDSLYDELEEPEDAAQVILKTRGSEAASLARYIRERIEKDQDRVREEMEKELNDLCPPRNIRSFRVIVVQDARTNKFPANRTAQLTIWDVLDLKLSESKPRGYFEEGWRCLVTNLTPVQRAAWMGHEPGSEIFLVSTRMSRWQKLKSLE